MPELAMSLIESIWRDARELPLQDAAFTLWRYRLRLDDSEFPPPKHVHYDDPAEERQAMQATMARIRYEHDHAHEGPTFDRLKRAHPEANDAHIRQAIRAAVKLVDDCERYFDTSSMDFPDAIDEALAKARRENRGFLESTWQAAGHYLVYCMK